MRLENTVALIRGFARETGAVETRLFAKAAAEVAIGDFREDEDHQAET